MMITTTRNLNSGAPHVLLYCIAALLCMSAIAVPALAEDTPVSDFTATPTTGVAPFTVQFTDLSTGSPTSWMWDFGDGSDLNEEQNPSHEYTVAGTYDVTLIAANDNGVGTIETKTGLITVLSIWEETPAWNTPDSGSRSAPRLVDLDNDGDTDLLIGDTDGISRGYENTGSAGSPAWTRKTAWDTLDIGSNAIPAFADLDGDGDYDLLIGEQAGITKGYQNIGTKYSPTWYANTSWNTPDVGTYSAPAIADLDGDGDYDLLIGAYDGNTYAYENTGSASSPVWTAKTAWNTPDIGSYSEPAFIDIDSDGDYDLLIGAYDGNTYAYENTGSASSPEWTEKIAWNVPVDIGTNSVPGVADLDNDGDMDVLVGSYAGTSYGYQNTLPPPTGCDLTISGMVNVAFPTVLFAREPNDIVINSIKNNGPGTSPATEVLVTSSDGFSGRASVPSLEKGGTTTVTITDPTIRDTADSIVTYTAMLDPDNTIAETNEANNGKESYTKTVRYNGYKGVQFWADKDAPKTYLAYDIHGNVIHSFGDSHYVSGKSSGWQTLTWHWGYNATDPIPEDIQVPAGASIRAARLYIPYCWDIEHEISSGLTTTTFNGVMVAPVHMENDTSNFGAYSQYEYGLVTYNVTDLYVKNGDNVATFTRTYWQAGSSPVNEGQRGSLSPAGFTLMVVYENPSETEKQIFINEGEDLLGASQNDYATTQEEATSYQEFTGMTIDKGRALQANLTTFVPWGSPQNTGDTGEGNLFVNGAEVATNVWNYGQRTVGESDSPQVAVDERDILSYLNAGGTGNVIGIQSSSGASPCMVAERSFLVVEYPDTIPVAAFSGTPLSGTAPLTVLFTDTSGGNPTTRVWDFGDGNSTWSTAETTFAHTYEATDTYDVTLTVTNGAGSDDEIKDNYIAVTAGVVTIPGQTNPPTDPDHDGKYEDLSGSTGADFPDVQLYFQYMDWIAANEPVAPFDYSNSGTIDFPDVQILFAEI